MAARILITREERPGERELAASLGLDVVFVPLTRVTFHAGRQTQEVPGANVVFTSRNAVEAMRAADLLNPLAGKDIWCVGPATAAALGGIPHRVSPGTTGEDLARFMLAEGVNGEVLHMCGEPRRPELKRVLEAAGCRVHEQVVYETVPVEADIPSEPIDAVAFFSPSAVRQFNALGWEKQLRVPNIAIGPTTASELRPSSCVVSREAGFRGVMETTRRILNVQF
jgi:uroporphyrinogen-III synthase